MSSLPENFFDSGKNTAADDARKQRQLEDDLSALGSLGKMTEKAAASRELEAGRDYAERDQLLKVEQQVMELRAADVRERVLGRSFGEDATASAGEGGAEVRDETDTSLSLLTTASFYRPPITVAEAARCFKARAGGGVAAAAARPGAEAEDDAQGNDDDELFVGLDGWA